MRQRGFTLVELTIAMALLSSGIMASVLTFTTISRVQQHSIAIRTVQQNSRYILSGLAQDIRNASVISTLDHQRPCTMGKGLYLTNSGNQGAEAYCFDAANSQLLKCPVAQYDSVTNPCAPVQTGDASLKFVNVDFDCQNCNQAANNTSARTFVDINMRVQYNPPGANLGQYDTYYYQYDLNTVVTPRNQS